MKRAKTFLGTSFGSALLGGLVVAAVFALALGAGWIKAESDEGPLAAATPLTAPVSAKEGDDLNLVNQIYRRDGRGVAFIEAELPAAEPNPFNPFGEAPE